MGRSTGRHLAREIAVEALAKSQDQEPSSIDAPVLRDARKAPVPPPSEFFTVHAGDVRRLEFMLSPYSSPRRPLLTSTITSPPYGALKDYGDPTQIGYGQPFDEYLVDMRRVFRSIYRHTKANGSMWVVADTVRQKAPDGEVWRMQMIPFELAKQAEGEGWILRDTIVWLKDKTLPWSSRGRMRNGFEYVLFFVKSPTFKYHVDRLREPNDLEQWWVRYPERYNPQGKAPANVWAVPIPVQGSWANTAIQHACPLPADLVERMLLLSTDKDDVVLDPFAGSGVVVAEAQRLARRGLGVELIERHIETFRSTVLPEITERRGVDLVQELRVRSDALQETILNLRSVKYPKVVVLTAHRIDPTLPRPFATYAFRSAGLTRDGRVSVALVIVLSDSDIARADDYVEAAERAMHRKPASKFGITSTVRVITRSEINQLHRGRRLWGYVGGQTHRAIGRCTTSTVGEFAARPSRHDVPLVVSNIYVNEQPRRLRGGTT
jgi:DNA modification methylase